MSKIGASIAHYRATASLFWQARTEQERTYLSVGGAVLALALVYSIFIAPAVDGSAQLRKSLPQLRQDAAELQALARTAAELAARPPVQAPPMTRDSLTASLTARGLKAQSVTMTGEYAKLELKDVSFAALVTWLDALRREQRVAVQESVIGAQGAPGSVDAALTLRQVTGGTR
ncbi:MAG: type II secretion system protein M [Pseudomonadota bacterium]